MMLGACILDDIAISPIAMLPSLIPETISARLLAVSLVMFVPYLAFFIKLDVSSLVSLAVLKLLAARLRTSSDTAKKPLPCCPARALLLRR